MFIPSPLRDLTGGVGEVAVEGATVGEVIDALDARVPGHQGTALPGRFPRARAAGVDRPRHDPRGLRAKFEPESEVHFLPVIGGG